MPFLHLHVAEWLFLLCSCLFIPFVITVVNRGHTHRASGEDCHSLVCLHRDREANWNVHCFLTRYCPQISFPLRLAGGRDGFYGDVHVGWVLKGFWEDSLVLVNDNGRNKSAAKSGTPLYHLLFFPLCLLFLFPHVFPSSLNLCLFLSILLCSAHFRGLGVKDSIETQTKCRGQKHICAWQFDRFWGFFDGQISWCVSAL